MMKIIIEKVVEANKSLVEVVEYLEQNKQYFQAMNLKLHDLNWAICSDKDFEGYDEDYLNDMFHAFCEIEYAMFSEWERENGIDENIREYINRTSSFYLNSKDIYYRGIIDMDGLLNGFISSEVGYIDTSWLDINKDNQLSIKAIQEAIEYDKEYFSCEDIEELGIVEDIIEVLDLIVDGSVLKYVKESLEDGIMEAKYILDFKESSIEMFKEFLQEND